MFETLLAGLIAGLLWLDRYQFLQLLVSRPIICATITGFALGNTFAGCYIGVAYELLWLRRPPVGGYIAPDSTLASVCATAILILVMDRFPIDMASAACLSFFITFPLTVFASKFDGVFRVALGKLALLAETALLKSSDKSVISYMLSGFILSFVSVFLIATSYTSLGLMALEKALGHIPPSYYNIFGVGFYSVIMIGIADLAGILSKTSHKSVFVLGLILALSLCCVFKQL